MALEAYLGLHPNERFSIDRKRLQLPNYEKVIDEDHHQICLSIPRDPMNLYSDSARKIALKFNKGTTTLAFVYKGGVVVCADSRATGGQYISTQECKKIIKINDFLLGTMAGGAADCMYWQRVLSKECRLFELRNKERISVAAASKILANILYSYKGMGLSLGVMICGWDKVRGPQIFYVDNDGNRQPGKLFSVGSGSTIAYGVLDTFYRHDMNDDEAYDLGRRSIFQATHRDCGSGGIVRVYTINSNGWKCISETDMMQLYDEPYHQIRPGLENI
ncbi:proteasome subunit beta type-5-like protein [Dermatophagoides farinae]|uniref:Proteasome subunit beta n=1 Tax=Dermatophagoides farinae TaxID=6954 RepID=A0A9D4NU39_DERFA|nr:proteasome subunit beta type-5-like [Dermatophagoides farinae]KAH7638714.1 proteasome subunit beta type-5-like protein [Dermatophagoides farinae]